MLTEETKNKWGKLLDECNGMDPIKDSVIRNNTIRLLENTQNVLLAEADPAISADGAGTAGQGNTPTTKVFDPLLINMIRRTQPVLVGNQMLGVQPMSGPTGLIFAMRTHRIAIDGAGAKTYTESGATYSDGSHETIETQKSFSGSMTTGAAEALGVGLVNDEVGTAVAVDAGQPNVVQENPWQEMGFTIDKATIEVKSRALKARYTQELAQDLKAIHGIDAETELSTLLSNEITGEIDREIVGVINAQAIPTSSTLTYNGEIITVADNTAGTIDMSSAAGSTGFDGRWTAEKAKQLLEVIGRLASEIAVKTRRGRANFILCSPNVAQYIAEAGRMNYLNNDGSELGMPDVANGPSFLGVLNGMYKVFMDPFAGVDFCTLGYKGASAYDAGGFYCPYVPMQFMRATGEEDFAPRIGFKTRYGLAANPYAVIHATDGVTSNADLASSAGGNPYFSRFVLSNF